MGKKILIVDDSKLARMSVAKVLSGLQPGWTRLEAANADEALAADRGGTPGCRSLLDFNMPGQSGLELAAELRASHPELPMAIISANIQVEIVARAHEAGRPSCRSR